MMKRSTWIWLVTVMVILVIVVYQFFHLDNIKNIPGEFEKVAYIRNENNQGGIYQYYAYTVGDTASANYEALIKMLPFNGKTGETTVFFFYRDHPYPTELTLEIPNFDIDQFQPVAVYVRNKHEIFESHGL